LDFNKVSGNVLTTPPQKRMSPGVLLGLPGFLTQKQVHRIENNTLIYSNIFIKMVYFVLLFVSKYSILI